MVELRQIVQSHRKFSKDLTPVMHTLTVGLGTYLKAVAEVGRWANLIERS